MTTLEVGRKAEDVAAQWLVDQEFTIVDRNWRTRWCELDIVAFKNDTIHIIEVKFRRRPDFGTGFEYITPNKAQRLRRAAVAWVDRYGNHKSYQIDIIAISGGSLKLEYLPNAIEGE